MRLRPRLWLEWIPETDKFTINGIYFASEPFRAYADAYKGRLDPPHVKLSPVPFPTEEETHLLCLDREIALRAALVRAHELIAELTDDFELSATAREQLAADRKI